MISSAANRIEPVMGSVAEPVTEVGIVPAADASATGLDFLSGQRTEKEFQRAKNHARRVRRLKIILPIIGLLIMMIIGAAFLFKQLTGSVVDIESIAFEDGKLVMENPNLNGMDKEKRPYSLTAERAIQDADQPKRVELVSPNARLPMDDTRFISVTAGNGIYDAEAKTLMLTETITVESSDGMRVEMEYADIDIDAGRLITKKPITATSTQADISSNSFTAEDNGERLVFEGKVRMTLRPKELREAEARSE